MIGSERSAQGQDTFQATNPATLTPLDGRFHEATLAEVEQAMSQAAASFDALVNSPTETRAALLDRIADGLVDAGDALLQRCHEETALPMGRLTGERGRTVNQTKLLATMLREGSWVDAKIDHGDPSRKPIPKPDVRSMLVGVGPVVVFGASNFPFAFSVAGTDTVAALAAGCPVVSKAHPAHPGTCELIAEVIRAAVAAVGLPAGVFSQLHSRSNDVGRALVEHPAAAAVAFTGSLGGGRALYDIAARRERPIPVFAEMASINPVFVLPGALADRLEQIAKGYVGSVTLGVGQFCTKPGVLLLPNGAQGDQLIEAIKTEAAAAAAGTMLHAGISETFARGIAQLSDVADVALLNPSDAAAQARQNRASCTLFVTDFATLKREPALLRELFGPYSTIIGCDGVAEMTAAAKLLDGQLTATLHGTESDLLENAELVAALRKKAGRLVVNGFPTGVEVCHAMHHGGPYPATTSAHFTSVGPAAIRRFVRTVCYQGFPDAALPVELQQSNPRSILRLVDGEHTRDAS